MHVCLLVHRRSPVRDYMQADDSTYRPWFATLRVAAATNLTRSILGAGTTPVSATQRAALLQQLLASLTARLQRYQLYLAGASGGSNGGAVVAPARFLYNADAQATQIDTLASPLYPYIDDNAVTFVRLACWSVVGTRVYLHGGVQGIVYSSRVSASALFGACLSKPVAMHACMQRVVALAGPAPPCQHAGMAVPPPNKASTHSSSSAQLLIPAFLHHRRRAAPSSSTSCRTKWAGWTRPLARRTTRAAWRRARCARCCCPAYLPSPTEGCRTR